MIVSNTTPLSCFLRIDRTDLVGTLFPDLMIPGAVAGELDRGSRLVGAWRDRLNVRVEAVLASPFLDLLGAELDPGEAEAIALAVERRADLLLIDEVRGRAAARRVGVPVVGSVGIIILAKHAGLIESGRPLIDDLTARGGLWLAASLRAAVLSQLGEA